MWFRRPRVEDMPPEGDHLTPEEIQALAAEQALERLESERLAEEAFEQRPVFPDHPDISADALLAWHAQVTAPERARQGFGLSFLEMVPDPEPEPEPEPVAVAAPPPTIKHTVHTTQEVWLSWLRGKKKR